MSKIFITGASGHLGAYLIRALLQKGGADITALKRPESQTELLGEMEQQINWIEGDIRDAQLIEDALADIDEVYHAAGVVAFDPNASRQLKEVNVEGTQNIVDAALYHNVRKLVHISSIAALGRPKPNARISEKTDWQRSRYNTSYAISKFQGELEVWRGIAEGLNAAILNPALFLGSGVWGSGSNAFFKWIWEGLKFFPAGTNGFVDIRDVAGAAVKLMESELSAERFIISGSNITYGNLLKMMAESLNKPAPKWKAGPLIRQLAWRVEAIKSMFLGKRPLLTRETSLNSSKNFYYENDKSVELLGLEYTPIEKTIAETGQQFLHSLERNWEPALLP